MQYIVFSIFRPMIIGETGLVASVLMLPLLSLMSVFLLVPHLNKMSLEMEPNVFLFPDSLIISRINCFLKLLVAKWSRPSALEGEYGGIIIYWLIFS